MHEPAVVHTSRIVVGDDLTETSDHAVRTAVQLARHAPGTELHLTYVIRAESALHSGKALADVSDQLRDKGEQMRAHVAALCTPPTGAEPFTIATSYHVRIGEPAAALHQVAVDVDADLIVVGAQSVSQRGSSSVPELLIRSAHVPVLIAHPKQLDGLIKTERPEPGRPGEALHGAVVYDGHHLEFLPRTPHISGLI